LQVLRFIVYRRWTMKELGGRALHHPHHAAKPGDMNSPGDQPLDRATAAEFAGWFKALADATRIQIVSLLARRGKPMSVGEIVAAVDVGQSTVSAHLKVLAEVRFVLADHRGTATYYRINDACVDCFPTAADIVMGKPAPLPPVPAKPRSERSTA
jgi:Bacterial regulatory protein, arsR family